jgi:transcriptional regulator with XRE-family HTH domain
VFPGNNIRRYRTEKGLNQRELARAANMDAGDVCALERNRKLLTDGWRKRLSLALAVDPTAL